MSVESAVFSALSTFAGGQVFPNRVPEGSLFPYVVYSVVGGGPSHTQQGISLRHPRVRVDVWSDTYDGSLAIAQLVITALDRNDGTTSATLIGELDLPEPQTGAYHRVLEFEVWSK